MLEVTWLAKRYLCPREVWLPRASFLALSLSLPLPVIVLSFYIICTYVLLIYGVLLAFFKNLFGMFCYTVSWNKNGLNGKLITWHLSPEDAADFCNALAMPRSLPCCSGIQRTTWLAWTREQLSPAEREARFFWQVTTKGFLSCAETLQCMFDPWGSTRSWWDRRADWLVIACQFLGMQVCLHCLSRWAQYSLWSKSGSITCIKGELRLIFETKLKEKGFIYSKKESCECQKTGKDSSRICGDSGISACIA